MDNRHNTLPTRDHFWASIVFAGIVCAAIISTALLAPTIAHAHSRWKLGSVTPPRTNDTGLKAAPCGGAPRTNHSTIFAAGQSIEVEFEETVNHDGYFKISFSPANDTDFASHVLVPHIDDVTNTGFYKQLITIPTQTCDACTLQLIQAMVTTDVNGQQNESYYYSCSDISITNDSTAAPQAVSGLAATPGNTEVTLQWSNPSDDFYRAVVLQSTAPISDAPGDGLDYKAGDMIGAAQVAYVGTGGEYSASALTNDTEYYFKVFAQNPRKNYAAGMETQTTPTVAAGSGTSGGGANNGGSTNNGGGGIGWLLILPWIITVFARRNPFSAT